MARRHGLGPEPTRRGHAAPIEIDLGMQRAWEVEAVVVSLRRAGCTLHLIAQGQVATAGELTLKRCRVMASVRDERRVRKELAEAGFVTQDARIRRAP